MVASKSNTNESTSNHNKREVTDPITHLPVTIHDYTSIDLEQIPPPNAQSDQPPSNTPQEPKSDSDSRTIEEKTRANNERHSSLDEALLQETNVGRWVDPRDTKSRMVVHTAIVAGVAAFFAAFLSVLLSNISTSQGNEQASPSGDYGAAAWLTSGRVAIVRTSGFIVQIAVCAALAAGIVVAYVYIISRAPDQIPIPSEEETQAPVHPPTSVGEQKEVAHTSAHERAVDQTTWLNAVLVTLWPIINPTLFTPLADILEDSLQASLPTFVKAVKIADISQGIEPVRIQQVQWLDAKRKKKARDDENAEERGVGDDGEEEEAGEYVCLELGLVYRSSLPEPSKASFVSLENRSTNPHMVLHLWTVAGVQIPFYISLHALLCTLRVRIALTPNPPFTSLATVTLLGAPYVSFSLTPLSRHLPNMMDVPVLSKWVKQSIDSAMEVYVTPRSVSLDLGLMLGGGERIDTEGVGVVAVHVIMARGYRDGDGTKVWKKVVPGVQTSKGERKGDAYVTVGWGKWGKPLWSSRIINDEQTPVWDELAFLVVSPAELNSHERLRLQLWDADKMTADDNLGNVQVNLRELMTSQDTLKRMSRREDEFTEVDGSTKCPGVLEWEVGYFPKVSLGSWILEMHQAKREHWQAPNDDDKDSGSIAERSIEEKERRRSEDGEGKEGGDNLKNNEEVQRLIREELPAKEKELNEKAAEIISGTPPSVQWTSGVLAVRIEGIDGLEVEHVRASGEEAIRTEGGDEEAGESRGKVGGDDKLPSAYCVILINHERVYKTRTKMATGKPYFDAGTERFIRDWQTTSIIVAVRDSRLHEVDPLLGVIDLPLAKLLKHRSHITDSFPLVGGIGYGRVKLTITFRSIELKLPKQLQGWETGTLEVMPEAWMAQTHNVGEATAAIIGELRKCRLVLRTGHGKRKMVRQGNEESGGAAWEGKKGKSAKLAVRKRYASCLVVEFRKRVLGPDQTPAFCISWMKDIPDDEETELSLRIRHNTGKALERAQSSAADDIGEVVEGVELRMKARFWRGLSGYHKKLAKKDKGIGDVMEVLDCVEEARRQRPDMPFEEVSQSGSSSSSSSSDEGDRLLGGGDTGGMVTQIKDFKKRKGQLHRKHRGLMQWSGARNMKWAVKETEGKIARAGQKVKEKVAGRKHAQKEIRMEKEV